MKCNLIWAKVAGLVDKFAKAGLGINQAQIILTVELPAQAPAPPGQPKEDSPDGDKSKKAKEGETVNLLDRMRSLNISIFLKQFRSSNEEIVEMVREGDHEVFGAEKLKGLVKILPEQDEIEMLKSFDGDKARLGNAERFILQLVEVPR